MTIFTKDDLADAFAELGRIAAAAGKVIDIAVYGGFALMLVSNFRVSSEDAVAIADQAFINGAAQTIGRSRGWPADWLNDGVRTYLSPKIEGTVAHELFATYPDERTPGLRVYVPTAEYLLAMKLMAMRVEAVGGKDLQDIVNLMQIVGVRNRRQIVDFAAEFYPEARTSGKLRLGIENLWTRYQRSLVETHEPPVYLGRSRPASEG
ncbi:MAG: hypothetical protein JO366_00580 [Methylobacteriaceae bacterium]|nr:hypothetical protein [Methylobacteriaceae bacterium]MBV9243288.1 hypothetical protein [Methylobacteriaceae bacterium]MBV9634626.1 hypothetical protein [Methylobacteriaceae bacterium]MBV9702667.1 hypothetical protein [Methylobacteriaceae bacterium]